MTPMGGHLNKEVEVEPPLSPPPPPPPQPSSGHKAAIGELVKSQELLKKLGTVVSDMPAAATEGGLVLVREAMKSITVAINALQGGAKATEAAGSMGSGDGRSENSGVVKRKCRKDAAVEKKIESKRRSTEASCRRITSKSLEDGYAWRKYGQKEIQNAKNPRSYFRCTHKLDRGCQATRQAQRSEDDPSVYHITYFGQHTCMDSLNPHKSGSNDPTLRESSYVINFGSLEQSQINPSPSITPLRGHNQDILSTNLSQNGSTAEPLPESVLAPPETSMPTTTIVQVSDVVSEHGDVTSSFHASMGFEMEFMNDDSLFADICGFFDI